MRILMIHPHDIISSVEPWTRRIKSLAIELVRNGYKVKLVYFPLSLSVDLKPHFLDGYEAIPFSRHPSPLVFLKNSLGLIKLGRWANIIHFQKCHHYASLPAVLSAYLNRKPLHYDWDDWEEMIWYESCRRNLHSNFIGFLFRALERFLPVLSDTVSVSSEYLKNLALEMPAAGKGVEVQVFSTIFSLEQAEDLDPGHNPIPIVPFLLTLGAALVISKARM